MHEEGGANGFTRQSFIVLNKNSLSQELFEHELFHIISRYNSEKISLAFEVLGFKLCNEIEIPHELTDLKISNPDAPFNNFFVELLINDKVEQGIMIIYAHKKYEGGSFFGYMNKRIMLVEGNDRNKRAKRDTEGNLILLKYENAGNLYDKIGKNTGYNIHQEEVSAEHFVMMLNSIKGLPNQILVDELKSVFLN